VSDSVTTNYSVDENGCWIWQRAKHPEKGYGMVNARSYGTPWAHRWMWIEANGPIPDGLELDHVCRVRACVNPEHMRLVTHAQNMQNRASLPGSSSRYRNVTWSKAREKWVALVTVHGKRHYLGAFDDEDEAGRVTAEFRRQHVPYSLEALAA
jgi:hypothetical protein